MLQTFRAQPPNSYPTSDGRPMAETDAHRDIMVESIEVLKHRYRNDKNIYVSGNLLLFYEEGNKRRHVSPDVFVVKDVPNHRRDNYLMWEEGKGPDVVIEITSKTTRAEDIKKKFDLYLNRMGVTEYFLFDPFEDYLEPSMQGFRRRAGEFRMIQPLADRLPSKVLGLHLERSGSELRFWDPVTAAWEPTSLEIARAEHKRAESERERAEAELARAEAERVRADTERLRADRLEREIEELRQRLGGSR